MFNFKRLSLLLKRKDKKYSKKKEYNVKSCELVDTSNYSDTMYNIVCSANNIPCMTDKRTLDYSGQLLEIVEKGKPFINFTNSVFIIYLDDLDSDYDSMIAMFNTFRIHYFLNKKNDMYTLMVSLSLVEQCYILLNKQDNQYLNTLSSQFPFTFDGLLYTLLLKYPAKYIAPELNMDSYHLIFLEKGTNLMLPLYNKEDKNSHIYVIEDQLMNFLCTDKSKAFNFEYVTVNQILNSFKMTICFDNFNKDILESLITEWKINDNERSIIILTYSQIIMNISILYKNSDKHCVILYNFFNSILSEIFKQLKKKYNYNIQVTQYTIKEFDEAEFNSNFIDGVDEII